MRENHVTIDFLLATSGPLYKAMKKSYRLSYRRVTIMMMMSIGTDIDPGNDLRSEAIKKKE